MKRKYCIPLYTEPNDAERRALGKFGSQPSSGMHMPYTPMYVCRLTLREATLVSAFGCVIWVEEVKESILKLMVVQIRFFLHQIAPAVFSGRKLHL